MKSFPKFIEELSNGLKKPLPGENAHRIMEASSAAYLFMKPEEQTRESAILLLLYPFRNRIHFPLILRNAYSGFHSGEVGFPGGRQEPNDKNLIQTALREAHEEVGIRQNEVRVLGTLTEIFIGPSNLLVLPVVGYIPHRPDFFPDAREVQKILEMPLEYFSDPEIIGHSEISIPGDLVVTPYYGVEGHKVWGATAKIIIELLSILDNNFPDAET